MHYFSPVGFEMTSRAWWKAVGQGLCRRIFLIVSVPASHWSYSVLCGHEREILSLQGEHTMDFIFVFHSHTAQGALFVWRIARGSVRAIHNPAFLVCVPFSASLKESLNFKTEGLLVVLERPKTCLLKSRWCGCRLLGLRISRAPFALGPLNKLPEQHMASVVGGAPRLSLCPCISPE